MLALNQHYHVFFTSVESRIRSLPLSVLYRIALSVLLLLLASSLIAQQIADPAFKAVVDRPAYTKNFPRVLFDEAHNNAHTAVGSFKPFADLIADDGYHVVRNHKSFNKETLDTFKVLVIVNALGAEDADEEGADKSAFTDEECDVVHDWVRGGGALLLLADQAPFGGAAKDLAKRFDVDMSKGLTRDPANYEKDSGIQQFIVYSRENKLLLDHPITHGRSDAEKINRVIAFSGQSLKGPDGSPFLKLADTAVDLIPPSQGKDVSAAGRAQGLAFKFGKGRVVVLGEATMLSAQVTGADRQPRGMNYPDIDNQQLALNIMHWLSGLLKER
jgi:hypothetical protein